MLEMMTTAPKWTLRPWKVTMENQLNSWSMYIPGVSSSNEVQEMKNFKDMIDAMTDEEVDDPLNKLNGPARERISRSTGRSMDEVTRLIFFYKQSLIVSTWLQERCALWCSVQGRNTGSPFEKKLLQEKGQRSAPNDGGGVARDAGKGPPREGYRLENVSRAPSRTACCCNTSPHRTSRAPL